MRGERVRSGRRDDSKELKKNETRWFANLDMQAIPTGIHVFEDISCG